MKPFRFFLLSALGGALVLIQVTWLRPWGWLNLAVHLPLLLVLIATVRADWRTGVAVGGLLGGLYQIFSPLPFWLYPVSFMLAAAGAWILRRRFVTSRTSTSVLINITGGTAVYYAVVATLIFVNKLFTTSALTPDWSVWVTAAAWQLVIHPVLAAGWWLFTRQRQTALHVGTW